MYSLRRVSQRHVSPLRRSNPAEPPEFGYDSIPSSNGVSRNPCAFHVEIGTAMRSCGTLEWYPRLTVPVPVPTSVYDPTGNT